jgi:hypothetical protein
LGKREKAENPSVGGEEMTDNLRIEICKSPWKKGAYNVRIGDISGSTEHSNISKEEVLSDIADEMQELKK